MDKADRIFVAGHRGMVGSGVVRALERRGYSNVLTRSREEVDLIDQQSVHRFFDNERPQHVVLAAAKVGGIHANRTQQVEFMYENLMIQNNVIYGALQHEVERLLFLGSSCIYPKHAPQPIREDSLLTSSLEPTNEGYALAKIAGLKLCEFIHRQKGRRFISAMPCNLYGSGDNFHPEFSHVIPGMMRRFHQAKQENRDAVTVWGTGQVRREFLHVDDLAEGVVRLLETYDESETINVGYGSDVTIQELSELMKAVVGFDGPLVNDTSMPDGTPRKLLDSSKMLATGWEPKIPLEDGLQRTYQWALEQGVFRD